MSEWQSIETVPEADYMDEPSTALVWVADGKSPNVGCVAFGRVYKRPDGTVRATATGFYGNWNITHWMPLPAGPAALPSRRQGGV